MCNVFVYSQTACMKLRSVQRIYLKNSVSLYHKVFLSSANLVCGGLLNQGDHGTLSSPGYPGNYPHNRDCAWTVMVSPGMNIMFTFAVMALEHHDNCSYDYVEVRMALTL